MAGVLLETAYKDSTGTSLDFAATIDASTEWGAIVVAYPRATAPSAPQNVSAAPLSMSSAQVTWEAPASGTVASYRVTACDVLGTPVASVSGIVGTQYVYTGLSPSTTYTFTVAAFGT